MTIPEEEYLPISSIERFTFCRRQWALIHLEDQWAENRYTIDGSIMHERAHDESAFELRGGLLTVRSLKVFSSCLGVTGACDVVEFRRCPEGVPLRGREGTWLPMPVEYKRGSPKEEDPAALQLCCQAMCLEEMLYCPVPEGALFYGEPHRRMPVTFTEEMRTQVREMIAEMRRYVQRGYTPRVKRSKACTACAMKELCLPELDRIPSARAYVDAYLREAAK